MAKNLVILIIVSILAVFFRTEVAQVIQAVLHVHDRIVDLLASVFSPGQWGQLIELSLVLFCIPVVVGFVVSGVYWLVKRTTLPFLMEVVWVVWFVLLTALAVRS